jgi:hypothetical protein
LKEKLKKIREFVWPMLDPPIKKPEDKGEIDVVVEDENLELAFNLQEKVLINEEDRRKGIESKAALFLSTISVASSLIIAATTVLNGQGYGSVFAGLSLVLSFIISIYAIASVFYSVKTLERKSFQTVDITDINQAGDQYVYKKNLISKMSKYAGQNSFTINEKIDFLAMAQAFYKRSLVLIGAYSMLICIFYFIYQFKRPVNLDAFKNNSDNQIHSIKHKLTDSTRVSNSRICDTACKRN